jgi:site-specific recombinase XerD
LTASAGRCRIGAARESVAGPDLWPRCGNNVAEEEACGDLTALSSLRAAVAAFKGHMCQEGWTDHTVRSFLSDLRILTSHLGAETPVRAVSTSDLKRFLEWLVEGRGVPCGPKSLARRVTTLKVFFEWLARSGLVEPDPAALLIHRVLSPRLPRVLSTLEVRKVLGVTQALRHAGTPDTRPHLLVTLLLHTGVKKGECMGIVMNHLDLTDAAHPMLWVRYADRERRHKERRLELPAWWPALLEEYRVQYSVSDVLFPCTARNLEYVLAGVADEARLEGGLSFEMLRWTCALRDHSQGMSDEELRQKLGVAQSTWRGIAPRIAELAARTA